ncbi:MAG TPA: acyltransferase [Acidimicrobiia bacterium]|nr:acyltransferase [Acidimicrobiia bacterium]
MPAFDGLRGAAVLLVVTYHFRHLLDPWTTRYARRTTFTRLATGASRKVTHLVVVLRAHPKPFWGALFPQGGSLGVDIFFVLSGFLITALLLREHASEHRISFRGFYRRRALRLLPALFLFVAAQLAYALVTHAQWKTERGALVAIVLYFWNWRLFFTYPAVPKGLAHLWSLSVEEQFYIVWPLVVAAFIAAQRRSSTVITAMVAAVVAVAGWRLAAAQHNNLVLLYFRTDVRADALLVGALTAYLWTRGFVPPRRVLVPAAWLSLAFVTGCVIRFESTARFFFDGGFTAVAVAVAVMIVAIVEADWLSKRLLTFPALRAVGRVSYGLYLWHFFVFTIVADKMSGSSSVTRIATAVGISTAATLFSWFVVEQRFLRRKHRTAKTEAAVAAE